MNRKAHFKRCYWLWRWCEIVGLLPHVRILYYLVAVVRWRWHNKTRTSVKTWRSKSDKWENVKKDFNLLWKEELNWENDSNKKEVRMRDSVQKRRPWFLCRVLKGMAIWESCEKGGGEKSKLEWPEKRTRVSKRRSGEKEVLQRGAWSVFFVIAPLPWFKFKRRQCFGMPGVSCVNLICDKWTRKKEEMVRTLLHA